MCCAGDRIRLRAVPLRSKHRGTWGKLEERSRGKDDGVGCVRRRLDIQKYAAAESKDCNNVRSPLAQSRNVDERPTGFFFRVAVT